MLLLVHEEFPRLAETRPAQNHMIWLIARQQLFCPPHSLGWEVGGKRLETSSSFRRLKEAYHGPQFTGICVNNRRVLFHRLRDLKQYCFNSIPPSSHWTKSALQRFCPSRRSAGRSLFRQRETSSTCFGLASVCQAASKSTSTQFMTI